MSKFSFSLTQLASRIAGVGTIAVLAAAAAPAQATLLSFEGEPSGYEIVTIHNNYPARDITVAAGQLQFGKNDGGVVTNILTYCVDIFQWATYSAQEYTLVDGLTHFGAEKASDLGRLFTGFDIWNTDNSVSSQETAALQLAVWEIVNETDTANGSLNLDLMQGNFSVASQNPGTTTLAQGWLNSLPGITTSAYQVSVYENATYQDQLVLNKIPEPGSVALMLGALGAMSLVARRRKTAVKATAA